MTNPLLVPGALPVFSQIKPEEVEPAIKAMISRNQEELEALLAQAAPFTWQNLMLPLEEMGDRLGKVWSPVTHMHATVETDALRDAYNACLPILTEYRTKIMQDKRLFDAIQAIADSPEFASFDAGQKKVIENELRDFRLAGVNLPAAAKEQFGELQKQLSKLTTQFSENLLDATQAWSLEIKEATRLAGLPDYALQLAQQTAEQKGQSGYLLTLDFPCYSAAMRFLQDRELRKHMYTAYVTRASDQDPHTARWDNTQVMNNILRIRHELANLLGFANYAEYSLATKMAKSPKLVLDFLKNLVTKSKAMATQEIQELRDFAKAKDGITELFAWDATYYSEKLREEKYAISQEILKPYFPAPHVLAGMFDVVNKLYGIQIKERTGVDTWHPQVKFFEIFDAQNQLIGGFYTDLYARPHKRDGAWMDECRIRRKLPNGQLQYPVAYLTCNFTRPLGDQPALLNQDEVETVFHEFGHCLHHLLTKIDYAPISGINGVAWDAVEFPSQIMEHWCWDKQTIALISSHIETGAHLPDELFAKMLAAKNFQSGLHMLRQLEFSLFDFRIHLEYDPSKGSHIQEILDDVRQHVSVMPPPAFNRFQHSFSHIFAGSYAAGYYSYKWAEVLSSDAFAKFEEAGIFDRTTGRSYLENILQVGGSRDPMLSFVAFRGREPRIDALLRHSGLVMETS